jgi:hypothetical protein
MKPQDQPYGDRWGPPRGELQPTPAYLQPVSTNHHRNLDRQHSYPGYDLGQEGSHYVPSYKLGDGAQGLICTGLQISLRS